MTDKERRKRHLLYDKYEKNSAKRIKSKAKSFLDAQAVRLGKHIASKKEKKSKDDAEKEAEKLLKDYDLKADEQALYKILYPLMYSSGEVGNELSNIVLNINDELKPFAIIEKDYIKFISKYGAEQSKLINGTSISKTREIIAQGIVEGLSYTDIGKQITTELKDLSLGRAEAIAATEVHTTFMVARDMKATIAGFTEKHWMDSDDAAVRPWHAEYDRLGWVPIDYLWGGVMKFPGDPSGSARELVRCRCEIEYR